MRIVDDNCGLTPPPGIPGDRVELIAVTDDYKHFALSAGQRGTVEFTDSLGTVHVRWDTGRRVGVISEDRGLLRPATP